MNLNTRDHYAIIAAFRGPDCIVGDEFALMLKRAFTARIRYWADPTHPWCETRSARLSDDDRKAILDMARNEKCSPVWLNHFLSHVDMALQRLRGTAADFPNVDPEELSELEELLRNVAALLF